MPLKAPTWACHQKHSKTNDLEKEEVPRVCLTACPQIRDLEWVQTLVSAQPSTLRSSILHLGRGCGSECPVPRTGWPGSALSLFWLLFCLFVVLSASARPLILSLLETRLRPILD